ncbi:centrosome-associated protein 350 [Elysia marginata]|uniref:Centrosome-associated protein 350 n=1 Tax=Elysia marginata TaxID=1093978 RepID=A0AAV4EGG4_9GAST|nr:centrosome-associated protein 350 [Elysia marginata]
MLKLKERLKQQRALASSSSASGSNDTSLADTSSSLGPPPALPPREPITGDAGPVRPRKIAAAHPAPGYRGFSTEPSDQHHSGSRRPNTKVLGGVKKKTVGVGTKRQPQLQTKKYEAEGATGGSAPTRHMPPQQEQRPKKVARLIASAGDKKTSKTGAKNIITTSSWRAGQDLILKELGMLQSQGKVKAKASASSQGQNEGQNDDAGGAEVGGTAGDGEMGSGSEPGEARAVGNLGSDDPLVNEVVAKSKTLSEDTRHMLKELQLGNAKESPSKEKSPHRPPKRKAPKPSATNPSDSERQQQPSEKTRHYDADSVRRFMAKQRADRLKRQQEEKLANERANQKRQQMMEKLAETQRAKAAAASSVARSLPPQEGERRKQRKDGRGTTKGNKENSEAGEDDRDDDSTLTGDSEELTPQATPRGDRDPEAIRHRPKELEQMEFESASQNPTSLLPAASSTQGDLTGGQIQSQPSGTTTIEFKGQMLNLDLGNVLSRFSKVVNQQAGRLSGEGAGPVDARHLQNLPMASSNSHPSGMDGTPPFDLGTSNAVLRTNEERKQAIKATALTLQNRLVEEQRKLEVHLWDQGSINLKIRQVRACDAYSITHVVLKSVDVKPTGLKFVPEPSHTHSHNTDAAAEFIPRYEKIAGSGDSFAVFNSHLPGSQVGMQPRASRERQDEAAARIQAAYRGHSVRGAANWTLPSGDTLGDRLRPSRSKAQERKHVGDEGGGGDASDLTETSSFSEISATDQSESADPAHAVNVAGNRRVHQRHRRQPLEGSLTGPLRPGYQPTQPQPGMPELRADPQSVMSIFSRQSKYLAAGSARAELPATSSSGALRAAASHANAASDTAVDLADLDFTNLKQPVITQTERTVHGQTASGQPIVAKARYTRLEATVISQDDGNQDVSSSASESAAHTRGGVSETGASRHSAGNARLHAVSQRSNEPSGKADKANRQTSHKSGRSEAYSMSFERRRARYYCSDSSSVMSSNDEDEDTLVSGSHQSHNQSAGASAKKSGLPSSYNRQVSDGGQETDVSQMSEDEPRVMRSKLESSASPRHHQHHHTNHPYQGTSTAAASQPRAGHTDALPSGRLSPNSLANKLSAGLNHLESMEESLRQVVGMERVRAVALAQQETVSLAQVLKARQQEHSSELRQLQAQAQEEAREATAQLEGIKSRPSAASLLQKEDNLRPESRNASLSVSRSTGRLNSARESLSQSPGNRRIKRSSATASLASVTKVSASSKTASIKTAADSSRNESSDSSIRSLSDADAADSRAGASASVPEEISRAMGEGRRDDDDDDDDARSYSMSFDESVTDEESFRQVLPSESHRKEVKQQEMHNASLSHDVSSTHLTPYGDLSSLFVGEENFSKFTAEMVRQIMKEEEYRAQHQAALLSLREKALREKAKAELAWLQQRKKKPRDKRADDVYPNFEKREKRIRKNFQEQQAEIRRLQEANKMASQERQMLLQQHEEIARIKENTNNTLNKLKAESPVKGRLARPVEVHTEDEVEEESEAGENVKDSKSDSEMYKDVSPSKKSKGDKKAIEKQRKLRLDQKYMTAREQKLYERKKQAEELLEWKKRLDAEEAKIYQLERQAMDAWGETTKDKDRKDKDTDKAKKAAVPAASSPNKPAVTGVSRRGVSAAAAATADDVSTAAISEHLASSALDETIQKETVKGDVSRKGGKSSIGPASAKTRSHTIQGSSISTQLSVSQSESDNIKSRTKTSVIKTATAATATAPSRSAKQRSHATASGSESSIPEEVPSASSEEKKKMVDSSDDTLINSSANDDYADTFEPDATSASLANQRKKSPVGKLLPQGNSPLPTPWSRSKTGSESESEDSISHTETMSDASDYEVRIRQLSDELRRRRKEVEILKKERSRRKKEKFKAQEVALKKQLDAYNIYIQQLKEEKDDLEHEPPLKSSVRPQIKQPGAGGTSPAGKGVVVGSSPQGLRAVSRHGEDAVSNSSSFEDMRDGVDSNQTSPLVDQKDVKLSPQDDKDKKKVTVSLMDRISEGSESDKSAPSRKGKTTGTAIPQKGKALEDRDISERSSSSMQEVIEEASQLDSRVSSEKTFSAAMKIKTSGPAAGDSAGLRSLKDEDLSYSMDFSDAGSTLAQSHSKVGFGSRAGQDRSNKDGSEAGEISEHIVAEEPSSVASAAAAKSPASLSSQLKFDFKAGSKSAVGDGSAAAVSAAESLPPSTGIQESDSETESRVNSYHTSAKSEGSSRPSSERSVGSLSYSAEDDEEDINKDDDDLQQDNDTSSGASEKTPVKSGPAGSPDKILPPVPGAKPAAAASSFSKGTEDEVSEHISASLPSISEKQGGGSHSNSLPKDSQDLLDSLLGYQEGEKREEEEEDDKTPVPTPREMLPLDEDEEENLSLLMTDPLADFTLGERVLIWGGQRLGTLRYKGKVDFSPGIWAGVELDQPDGDHDGMQEGTRYFSCLPRHGVIVQGSDIISADTDKESRNVRRERLVSDEGRSLDESLTTEDSRAEEGAEQGKSESIFHSTPMGSPNIQQSGEKLTATPVKAAGDKLSASLLADTISEQLEASLVQDSLEAVVGRLSAQSSPAKKAVPPLPSTPPPSQARLEETGSVPEIRSDELPEDPSAQKSRETNKDRKHTTSPDSPSPSSKQRSERTADGVMRSLLDEAISDMVTIKRRKAQTLASSPEHLKLNGDLGHRDKQALLGSVQESKNIEDDNDNDDNDDDDFYTMTDEKVKDKDSGLSLDPVHRPASPIPGDAPTEQDQKELNDELSGLLGEYIDDDLGLLQQLETGGKTGGDQQVLERSSMSVPEDIPPVVPQTKDEITPIISRAVDIFWTSRRYGESLDGVQPPAEFLSDWESEEMKESLSADQLTSQSRRSWKHMLFDLTGEIIRDIYQDENKPDPPVWQKAQHRSHKFFKGSSPPTTVDGLRPLVQRAVSGLLDLDGPGSRHSSALVNKWNIRKKKDAVDAVLVSELAQEEKGWVNYDEDELNLKMSLADSLFDTLLSDTVATLNGIYQRRNPSKV